MTESKYYMIAVDVAKESLRVQTPDKAHDLGNGKKDHSRIAREARKFENPLVILEATGGYERPLVDYLRDKEIASIVINPRCLRAFAKSEGVKAKSDPIDARMILRFAIRKKLTPCAPPSKQHRLLIDLFDRRDQLSETIAREKNRMKKCNGAGVPVSASLRRSIHFCEKEIERIEKQINKLIDSNPQFKQAMEVITSVVGIGEVTAWSIIANLREIGQLNRNQLAALVGVAPYNADSGGTSNRRHIQGGRAKVRNSLYMAANAAARFNPVIKPYVEGLKKRGKPHKCAMVAAMRKLIVHIQSELRKHQISLA